MKVFRCPTCQEFIAADATQCRFCSAPLDAEAAKSAAAAQEKENKLYRRKHYARHMSIGVGLFALGLVITVATFAAAASSPEGGYYVITYGLMLSGVGDFLYGLVGWLGELK
jgi:uncharacterized membrane protein YvbJ